MTRYRKRLTIITAAILMFALAACGGGGQKETGASAHEGHESAGADSGMSGEAEGHRQGEAAGDDAAAGEAESHQHGNAAAEEGAAEGGETGHSHGSGASATEADDVQAAFTLGEGTMAGEETMLEIMLTQGGKPIESFDTNHEEKQHLIIVSKDLSFFNHIHPAYKGNGLFEVKTQFPAGGDYRLIADFVPTGGEAMHRAQWVTIPGDAAPARPVEPQTDWQAAEAGINVQLAFDAPLAAGKELTLAYTLENEKTGKPVTDLQPYLGAIGHVVILSEDAEQYLHVHPLEGQGSGPEAKFMTTFPSAGIYKIWAQFKRGGEVFTVPFVVEAK